VPFDAPRTAFEGWQRMRVLPVKFTDFQKETYFSTFQDKTAIHLGSFVVTKDTRYFDEMFSEKDQLYFKANLSKPEWKLNYDSQCFNVYKAAKIPLILRRWAFRRREPPNNRSVVWFFYLRYTANPDGPCNTPSGQTVDHSSSPHF
jgi:hypothetical protein